MNASGSRAADKPPMPTYFLLVDHAVPPAMSLIRLFNSSASWGAVFPLRFWVYMYNTIHISHMKSAHAEDQLPAHVTTNPQPPHVLTYPPSHHCPLGSCEAHLFIITVFFHP